MRKAHAGKAIILCDDNFPRPNPIDQRKVYAAGTVIEDQRIHAVPYDTVSSIAADADLNATLHIL